MKQSITFIITLLLYSCQLFPPSPTTSKQLAFNNCDSILLGTDIPYFYFDSSSLSDSTSQDLYKWIKQIPESIHNALIKQSLSILITYKSNTLELNFEKQKMIYQLHSSIVSFIESHMGLEQGIPSVIIALRMKEHHDIDLDKDYFDITLVCLHLKNL